MTTIKTPYFNCNSVKYPNGISTLDEFVRFLNRSSDTFIKVECFAEDNCVDPYYLADKTEIEYININTIRQIGEHDVHIMTEDEYRDRLADVIANKCVHCLNYTADICKIDHNPHRHHINLDGECYSFEMKTT